MRRVLGFRGKVVPGRRVGRRLGFPTANLAVRAPMRLPAGVFVVFARGGPLRGPRLGVLNVGTRPTFEGTAARHVEVHLPAWRGNLYGRVLEIRLIRKIRSERKFAGLGQLKAQIRRDVRDALKGPGPEGPKVPGAGAAPRGIIRP